MFNWFKHNYPYTNFHELNIDWVIERILWLVDKVSGVFPALGHRPGDRRNHSSSEICLSCFIT